MMGKTPDNIQAIRPLRDGVIADIDVAEQMLKYFMDKAQGGASRFVQCSHVVICVPSGSTMVERRAIRVAASNAGAESVQLIEIGSAHVRTPVTNAPLVCRLLLEKKNYPPAL